MIHEIDFQELINQFTTIITTLEIFRDYGLWILFFWAITPTIFFIPDEIFILPLVILGYDYFPILLALAFGNFIGYVLLYYLGHHADRLIFKKNGKIEAKANHWLHKYKHIVFFLPPFASFAGELIMIYAGTQHIPLRNFWWILLSATFVRGLISILLFMGILAL